MYQCPPAVGVTPTAEHGSGMASAEAQLQLRGEGLGTRVESSSRTFRVVQAELQSSHNTDERTARDRESRWSRSSGLGRAISGACPSGTLKEQSKGTAT